MAGLVDYLVLRHINDNPTLRSAFHQELSFRIQVTALRQTLRLTETALHEHTDITSGTIRELLEAVVGQALPPGVDTTKLSQWLKLLPYATQPDWPSLCQRPGCARIVTDGVSYCCLPCAGGDDHHLPPCQTERKEVVS